MKPLRLGSAPRHVLGDCELWNERRLLGDRRDAVIERLSRRAEGGRRSVEEHPTSVRRVNAGDYPAERRLARAVLSDDRVDVPGDRERYVIERTDASEVLRDALELEVGHVVLRCIVVDLAGHSALNFEAFAFVTIPPWEGPSGRRCRRSSALSSRRRPRTASSLALRCRSLHDGSVPLSGLDRSGRPVRRRSRRARASSRRRPAPRRAP